MPATSSVPSQHTTSSQSATNPQPDSQPPRLRLPAGLRALRHRNYRLFFSGQLISLTGTWMQAVAQGWLVLRLTDSPFLLGLVAAMNSLPVLLFSLPAGALADQISKRTMLIATQTVAMVLALSLAFLTISGWVTIWHVLLMAGLLGVVNAFDAPARQSFTVEMVGREDLLNAIALNASIFNAARTLGPAVAGIIVALIGEGPTFLLNGLSFIAVLCSLFMMRMPARPKATGPKKRGQLAEGFRYIAGQADVRALLLTAGGLSMFGFVHIPLMPVFARDVLGQGAAGLGWLSAASGAGALVAALALAQFGDKLPRGRLLAGAAMLHPLAMIGFTMARDLAPAMAMIAIPGLARVACMAITNTLIQSVVPDHLRGRVMSVFTLMLMGLSPLGGLSGGAIAEAIGNVPLVVAADASIALILGLGGALLAPNIRGL